MRVLLVTPHFPPRYIAGVELITARLAASLLARGHEPEVVCVESLAAEARTPIAVSKDAVSAIPVHRLALRPTEFGSSYHDPHVEEWLVECLQDRGTDVVHLQSGYLLGGAALAAARRAGVPIVVTCHDYWFICPRLTLLQPGRRPCSGPESDEKCAWCLSGDRRVVRTADRWTGGAFSRGIVRVLGMGPLAAITPLHVTVGEVGLRRARLRELLAGADAVLATSSYLAGWLRREHGQPRVRVVRSGLDYRQGGPASRRRDGPFRVAYIGQIAPHKGVHVAVAAVRQLEARDVVLSIHGPLDREPAYVVELQRIAAGDARVRFAGGFENSRVGDLLADTDLLLVPSLWQENYPTVILEARAHGVPVVATRMGGMPEMIDDGLDGILVPPGDAAAITDVIRRLGADRAAYDALRRAVRPPRTLESEVDELIGIYTDVSVRSADVGSPRAH